MIPTEWRDLAEFQLHAAERWLDRGAGTQDWFARFFFYFAGLNSLYFLWRKVDGVPGETLNRPPSELRQIQHLLGKAESASAGHVLETAAGCVRFFAERRPIQRMDKRSSHASAGDPREGHSARRLLRTGTDTERLGALGVILYLVRSNLVHGSKMDQGDDEEVVKNAVPGLGAILDWSIEYTRSELEVR